MSKVLVVDDEAQNRYMLEVLLKAKGYDVVSASDGVEALELARCEAPSLIISDILMPRMDGFTLCREWLADEFLRDIPFVFYTATYTDQKDEDLALRMGAARFIVKPQEPGPFMAMIEDVLELSEGGRFEVQHPGVPWDLDTSSMYSDALVRKLEKRAAELETAQKELLAEVATRKALQAEIARALEEWEFTFDAMSTPIAVLDEHYVIQKCNLAMAAFCERSREDVLGCSCRELIYDGTSAEDECLLERVRACGRRERAVIQQDGRWLDILVDPILGVQGQVNGCIHVIRDITRERQIEGQLREKQRLEAVGQLAGGVAHEFNNVLMGIMNYVELCRDKLDPAHPIREWLHEISVDTQRSAELTRQLLAFARKQAIAPKRVDLNETIAGMLKLLRRSIGANVDLVWEPGSDLWHVHIDPGQIDQVLANLCMNARDALDGGGKVIVETENVRIDADYCGQHEGVIPGDFVMLAVSDTGCGMDAETLEHVFEPFFTTKEAGVRTGLGLATVHGIVKQNGGHIRVDSEVGGGTAFRIYLPRVRGPIDTKADKPAEDGAGLCGKETILLVDDEKSVRVTAAMFLKRLGYTVLVAEAPDQACRLADEHLGEIDLLITDMAMPGMNGKDLADRLAKANVGLKCLYMSGYTADAIADRGVQVDGVDFLAKPFDRDALTRKVREVLDGR